MTDSLIAAARFLTAQLSWLRHATDEHGAPVAADVFREIGDCAARMRSLVDGPREQKYLGPCGAYLLVEVEIAPEHETRTCEGDVYGVAGAQTGRCRTCGATVEQDKRTEWLNDQVTDSDLVWTARGIADAYGISEKTIRSWATERRTETGYILRKAKLGTFWRDTEGRLVPWVEPDDKLTATERKAALKARGDRLHYVADVTALAREAAERRAERAAQH